MALPEGVTTATVTAGVPVTHTGAPVKAFLSIEPSVFLVHTATGTPLVDFLEELAINEGVAGQFTLPHTDQAGFQDENGNAYTNWYYTARITYSTPSKAKTKAPRIKVFQLATGQTSVDLDSLPGGAPALPYTAPIATVTSVNGRTGPVTIVEGDLPTRLSEASLNTAYAGAADVAANYATKVKTSAGRVAGGRTVYIGDSIYFGDAANTPTSLGPSWPNYASILSGQALRMVRNSAIGGQRSDQILARMDADVWAYTPQTVIVGCGTNDILQGYSFASFQANIAAIIANIQAHDSVAVISTIPPHNSATYHPTISLWNVWLKMYAATKGVPVLDFHEVLADPATGNYNPAMGGEDQIHPNGGGYHAMGKYAADRLAPAVRAGLLPLVGKNNDANNILTNALFLTDTNADGVPDGYNAFNGSGYTHSLVTEPTSPAKMARITMAVGSTTRTISSAVISGTGKFVPGDKMLFAGRVGAQVGSSLQIFAQFTNSGVATGRLNPMNTITGTIDPAKGAFAIEGPVPAASNEVQIYAFAGSSAVGGWVQFGQLTLLNLTKLGLA